MHNQGYDITYNDLNPTFLFTCKTQRSETESNYHSHDHIELSIILKGQGVYYINEKEYPVKAGDLIILNPGTYHKSMVTHSDDFTTEYYIGFSDIHLRENAPNTFPLADGKMVLSMNRSIQQEIFKLCALMTKEFEVYRPGQYFMLKAYLIQLLLLLLREKQNIVTPAQNGCIFESPHKNYVVNQMIHYFNKHYSEKISLDQIAQNMYLSIFYISKIFKSETGDTPINYLIQLRMEKARKLMETEPASSIQSIAAQVGYEDAYYFSKLFKKHFNVSPSKYRSTFKI